MTEYARTIGAARPQTRYRYRVDRRFGPPSSRRKGDLHMRSSHILCKVHDLPSAVRKWEDQGFVVQLGDAPDKAMNALVWFEGGPFIELIDVRRAQPPWLFRMLMGLVSPDGVVRRLQRWLDSPEGWCEFSLETHDTDVAPGVKKLRANGTKIFGPVRNKRTPVDSVTITTQTAFPHETSLPILMGAYRPNPRPKQITHPNGVTSVAHIAVRTPQDTLGTWHEMLDVNDPWLALEVGEPAVRCVSLSGLSQSIPPELINGAVVEPA